jgi:hypothetical protein
MGNREKYILGGWLKLFTALAAVTVFMTIAIFSHVLAQEFTQGYSSDEQLIRGSIVAIDDDDPNKVLMINDEKIGDVFGIVVRANDSALTLTSDRTGVFVTTSGRYEVLVSDINGAIRTGDDITLSSIKGVGMLADPDHITIVGTALEPFDIANPETLVLSKVVTNDASGTEVEIAIGRILVEIGVKPNPDARRVQQVPQFLAAVAETITGNSDISAFRIYSALAVLLLASAIAGSLLYSAVRNSIVSIGRNPLSKKSVLAGLAQVVVVGVIIFLSGLVAVYLILKI